MTTWACLSMILRRLNLPILSDWRRRFCACSVADKHKNKDKERRSWG
jgi:hypothetical protein